MPQVEEVTPEVGSDDNHESQVEPELDGYERFESVFSRCDQTNTKLLSSFLQRYILCDTGELAVMPGTPEQVLCTQFLHYVKCNFSLTEELKFNTGITEKLFRAIIALDEAKKKKRRSR